MPKVLWHDGLGQYNAVTDLLRRQGVASIGGAIGNASLVAGSRAGAKAIQSSNGGDPYLTIGVAPSTPTQGCIGSRMKLDLLPNLIPAHSVQESDGTRHITTCINVDGSIGIRRGTGAGTVLGTSAAGLFGTGTWIFVETRFTIHDTTGLVEVSLNGVVVLTVSGVDTRNGGTAGTWSAALFGIGWPSASNPVTRHSDLYVADATDSHETLGDCRTDYHVPIRNGANSGWTPSAGVDHFATVDDVPSNGDTDYNSTTTVNVKDTLGCEDSKNAGGEIVAVTPLLEMKKVNAGSCLVRPVLRIAGVDYPGNDLAPSDDQYRYMADVPMMTNPASGTAWSEAVFNDDANDLTGYQKTL